MKTSDVVALALGLVLAAACAPLKVLAPENDARGCNPNTEHDCAGGGCCLTGWVCGGKQPDAFVTCPQDSCCDSGEYGVAADRQPRIAKKRSP